MPVDATATKEAIRRAALALVADGDLSAVTVAALAARSGASNGSIYHHFGSREGVLRALLVSCFGELVDELRQALDARPAEDCIRDLVRRHLAWVAATPGPAHVVYGVPLSDVALGDELLAGEKADAAAQVVAWFAARSAAGEMRDYPAWALDPVVLGPVHEVCRRALASGQAGGLVDVRDVVADAVWAMLAP